MKRILLGVVGALLVVCLAVLAVFAGIVHSETSKLHGEAAEGRSYLLSDESVAERQLDFRSRTAAGAEFPNGLQIAAEETASVTLRVKTAGQYDLVAVYAAPEKNLFENPVNFTVNGAQFTCTLSFLWADDVSEMKTDRYGNEVLPEQYQLPWAASYLKEAESFSGRPLALDLPVGEVSVTLQPQNQSLLLYGLYAVEPQREPSYAEYLSALSSASVYAGERLTLQGEAYRAKNDSSIRGTNIPNTSVSPASPYVKRINATADESNKHMGQKLYYEVEAPEDGLYFISFKYCQPKKAGGCSYRTIEIDGNVPYTELRDVGFAYTGINTYQNKTLDTGVYLTRGVHLLALEVTAEPMQAPYRELMAIVNEINDTGIALKRIKGNNSGESAGVDTNRTWDILQYMPDILDRIEDWSARLTAVYDQLKDIGGMEPTYVSDLMLTVQNLQRLAEKPREIPNKLSLLSDDSSSAAQLAALTLTKIYEQSLSIDCIYLHGENEPLPAPKAGMLSGLAVGIKQFLYSFSRDMNESADVQNEGQMLTVWINKPSQYVETLRQLTADEFTRETGIEVSFSIMPDEKKITLANSTGSNPDLALGLSYYRPAEFAMRGMAVNLLEFDDFLDWYGAEYNLRALAPMAYEDGVYGASETQEFYVLFYRKDILDSLGLTVPDTWDDVKAMMPVLHRNAMNFNLPLANTVGYKSFEATGGFLFQNGGDYYSPDGFASNFGDPNTLRGLREMVELYQVYGLAQNIPNFFNAFRSGSVPIGVSNFSTYLQLQVGAPELNGRWDIALVPGTQQADGTVRRDWSADATSSMIFSNSQKKQEAYCFLKWWLSSGTQLKYATDLQMKYGPDYIWNTGNRVALAGMSYPLAHKKVILEQWSWQHEALRHPASYILEREVSNAWIAIVTQGEPFQARIDEATLASNREIQRKLTEFGYLDENGQKRRDYNIHLIEDLIERREEDGQ
jgi:ABC-type glycerol-3-phosphate transport system substrate-binding protein